MNLFSNTIAYNATNEIANIIKPLRRLHVTYFAYTRIYTDGTRFFLNNHDQWLNAYHHEFYDIVPTNFSCDHYIEGAYLGTQISPTREFQSVIESFNISVPVVIIFKSQTYTELFIYAGEPGNYEFLHFALGHKRLLYRFANYFKAKAKHIIDSAESDRYLLPLSRSLETKDDEIKNNSANINQKIIESFFHETATDASCYIHLTKREIECAHHLLKGMSNKEIAQNMNISPRTAEAHIQNLLHKFKCRTRTQLTQSIRKLDSPLSLLS